jgi:phosphopantetheinyl transferase (holo-ACP synthase)
MTYRMPAESLGDWILRKLGKRRAVFFPRAGTPAIESYSNVWVAKESFWKALLRPTSAPLPEGSANLYELRKELELGGAVNSDPQGH